MNIRRNAKCEFGKLVGQLFPKIETLAEQVKLPVSILLRIRGGRGKFSPRVVGVILAHAPNEPRLRFLWEQISRRPMSHHWRSTTVKSSGKIRRHFSVRR